MQEAKQLLVDLYADQELLALLREVLTMEEQAAYLQPTMLLSFLSMLDKVQLSGNVTVRRQFDSATGAFLHESVYLPFAEGFPVSEVTLVHLPQETGDGYQVSGALKAGLTPWSAGSITFDVTAVSGGEGIWSGDVRVTIPGSTDAELLEPIPDQAFAFSYNLDIPEPVVNNDVYGGRFEKTYAATLLIRPEEGSGLSPLSVKAGAVIYSKSSSVGSVTYLESTLDVTDMDTSSVLHLSFDGKTATGWTPLYLAEAPANALRVDLLDANGRTEILNALLTKLTGAAQ
ncbi:MAG: hypothetical protein IJ240_07515 [Clostridia bacterium]|nr:hypothetical protein [Clostridia bacterium]